MAEAELLAPVILRRFDLSDLDGFWIWASDARVTNSCSWEVYKNKDDLRRYMAESVLPNPCFLAIIAGGRPLGVVSLTIPEAANDRCRVELGYVLEREWWGKGVATAAGEVGDGGGDGGDAGVGEGGGAGGDWE
ncbi:hypothetical protein KSP39_PZI004775 [Platanthera zijinensis]|uniref:N-acetyltransferase domain-containing protein n=1 Tax=Platanthera zijinensis TaxID=2320716 RepID=A0AAP0BTF6_9ASPA